MDPVWMSALPTPAAVRVSTSAPAFVLSRSIASAADDPCTFTPRLSDAVSGLPDTTPTPSTVIVRLATGSGPGATAVVGVWATAGDGPPRVAASTPTPSRATTMPPPATGTIQRFIGHLRVSSSPSLTTAVPERFPVGQAG